MSRQIRKQLVTIFKCTGCSGKFNGVRQLQGHRCKSQAVSSASVCKVCDHILASHAEWKTHMKEVHKVCVDRKYEARSYSKAPEKSKRKARTPEKKEATGTVKQELDDSSVEDIDVGCQYVRPVSPGDKDCSENGVVLQEDQSEDTGVPLEVAF